MPPPEYPVPSINPSLMELQAMVAFGAVTQIPPPSPKKWVGEARIVAEYPLNCELKFEMNIEFIKFFHNTILEQRREY